MKFFIVNFHFKYQQAWPVVSGFSLPSKYVMIQKPQTEALSSLVIREWCMQLYRHTVFILSSAIVHGGGSEIVRLAKTLWISSYSAWRFAFVYVRKLSWKCVFEIYIYRVPRNNRLNPPKTFLSKKKIWAICQKSYSCLDLVYHILCIKSACFILASVLQLK